MIVDEHYRGPTQGMDEDDNGRAAEHSCTYTQLSERSFNLQGCTPMPIDRPLGFALATFIVVICLIRSPLILIVPTLFENILGATIDNPRVGWSNKSKTSGFSVLKNRGHVYPSVRHSDFAGRRMILNGRVGRWMIFGQKVVF